MKKVEYQKAHTWHIWVYVWMTACSKHLNCDIDHLSRWWVVIESCTSMRQLGICLYVEFQHQADRTQKCPHWNLHLRVKLVSLNWKGDQSWRYNPREWRSSPERRGYGVSYQIMEDPAPLLKCLKAKPATQCLKSQKTNWASVRTWHWMYTVVLCCQFWHLCWVCTLEVCAAMRILSCIL